MTVADTGSSGLGEASYQRPAVASAVKIFLLCYLVLVLVLGTLYPTHRPRWVVEAYWYGILAALIWPWLRGIRVAARIDNSGIAVRNFFRSYRIGWPDVIFLADGSTNGRDWALTVMRRDGRAVTATATRANEASPETLTAVRQAAQRYGVQAYVTGVAGQGPRGRLDAASEATLQATRLAAWLLVSAVSLAAAGLLVGWGLDHRHDFYPAADVASLAVIGLPAALRAWRTRHRVLGPADGMVAGVHQDYVARGDGRRRPAVRRWLVITGCVLLCIAVGSGAGVTVSYWKATRWVTVLARVDSRSCYQVSSPAGGSGPLCNVNLAYIAPDGTAGTMQLSGIGPSRIRSRGGHQTLLIYFANRSSDLPMAPQIKVSLLIMVLDLTLISLPTLVGGAFCIRAGFTRRWRIGRQAT